MNEVEDSMLQTLYARYKESMKKNHLIYDEKAIEIVNSLSYDYNLADKDSVMSSGVIARTLLLDEMVKDYLDKHPHTIVINLACGLDMRCYRMKFDRWYNIDLKDVIDIRGKYVQETDKIKMLAYSAMDETWCKYIKQNDEDVLVIVEGLSMYLNEKDVKKILKNISSNYNATVFFEILNPMFVNKRVEKSIKANFTYGCKNGLGLVDLDNNMKFIKDYSLSEKMVEINKIYKVLNKIPFIYNLSNKISVLTCEHH